MKKSIWAGALLAATVVAAPAAQASTLSSGWIRNPAITQPLCISLAREVGQEGGYEVAYSETSASFKNDDGDLIVLVCDASPYIFFMAVHDTKPREEVEAMADWVEARLGARIEALP